MHPHPKYRHNMKQPPADKGWEMLPAYRQLCQRQGADVFSCRENACLAYPPPACYSPEPAHAFVCTCHRADSLHWIQASTPHYMCPWHELGWHMSQRSIRL